jgi:cysteine desulfurase
LAKIPVDCFALGVDYLSVSAHKIGGPQGVGALVVLAQAPLAAQIVGGGQERWRRAGTENVAGIAAFGAAIQEGISSLADMEKIRALRDRAERALLTVGGARIIGGATQRLPNTICIAVPGAQSATLIMKFDLAGIAVSAGSACSSGKVHASHVLQAMGIAPGDAEGVLRISLGWDTSAADVDRLIATWGDIWAHDISTHNAAASCAA